MHPSHDRSATSHRDLRAYADDERKRLRESFSCVSCGSPDPARIDTRTRTCSDCPKPAAA